jgi:uncharacterized repeat protein (TIGR01451 family)
MPRSWGSRSLKIVGIGALVVGAGLVVAAPANAAPVSDVAALRQAVNSANSAHAAADIELVPGTTYSLPGAGGCGNGANAGDLSIASGQPVKIFTPDGQAPAVLEMTCDPATTPQRVIQVLPDASGKTGKLTLRNVVIKNGHSPNQVDGGNFGGGVLSTGDVAVENSTFDGNTAGDGRTGDQKTAEGGAGGFGGGLAADGVVTIDGSTFTGNRAGNGGNGFAEQASSCDGGLGGEGGAVVATRGLTITNSTFTGNSAGNGGNGPDGECGSDHLPAGGDGGNGGAVQCGLFRTANDAVNACQGPMVVRASTFSGNIAGNGGNGGAFDAAGPGGAGGRGGAIAFAGGKATNGTTTLLVENSTVDGNSSGNGGKGGDGVQPGNGGDGGRAGGIIAEFADRSVSQVATLVHDTITENGGGGAAGAAGTAPPATVAAAATANAGAPGGGSVELKPRWESNATLIGVSAPPANTPDCWVPASTTNTANRTTVADDNNGHGCGFPNGSVLPFDGFALGSLSNNGGPTQTRLPAATSTLVDKVVSGPLAVDQRGVPRPQAAGADIGAVELQLIDMTVTKTASASSVAAGTAVTFTITTKNTGTSSPQPGVTLDDPNCSEMSAASGDTNANNTLDPGEVFTFTCKATPSDAGTFTNTASATITDGAGNKITRTASVDVTVTAAAGGTTALANTGTNDPTPELMTGAWLVIGGALLLFLARPRRIRIRTNTE